jgi:hypothetical protein
LRAFSFSELAGIVNRSFESPKTARFCQKATDSGAKTPPFHDVYHLRINHKPRVGDANCSLTDGRALECSVLRSGAPIRGKTAAVLALFAGGLAEGNDAIPLAPHAWYKSVDIYAWAARTLRTGVYVVRNSEQSVYNSLMAYRNARIQIEWSQMQMFLVFHTIALPLIFAQNTDINVRFSISIVGLWVETGLFISIINSQNAIKFANKKLQELELLDQNEDNNMRIKVFTDPWFNKKRTKNRLTFSRSLFYFGAVVINLIWSEEAIRHGLTIIPSILQRFHT